DASKTDLSKCCTKAELIDFFEVAYEDFGLLMTFWERGGVLKVGS
ncbi:27813_t:CDS:1, partial [Racocetra persica]